MPRLRAEVAGMTATCPCCGSTVERDVIVDIDGNAMAFRSRLFRLSPQQAEIMHVLARKAPGSVRRGELIAAVYGQSESPENADRILSIRVAQLRRMFGDRGLRIETIPKVGYRLTEAPA